MIKNVIFDIGNVLVDFDETNYATKLFGSEKGSRILDGLWCKDIGNDFDRGILDEEIITKRYIELFPDLEKEILIYLKTVGDCIEQYEYTIPWIKKVKSLGYNVYFLSNYSKWFIRSKPSAINFVELMDGGVFSCDCHFIKPEKEIYEYICNKYNLNKEECLFIDDLSRNINAARLYGMNVYHFLGYDKSYEEIMNILKENRNAN